MVHIADIPYRNPAGIAYVWGPDGGVAEELLEKSASPQTAAVLGPGLLAFLPGPGSAEVIEAALTCLEDLLALSRKEDQLRGLIFPGLVEHRRGEPKLVSDGLVDDLRRNPPQLEGSGIFLTGHATRELETPWDLESAPTYTGPSGRSRTLWKAGHASPDNAHYRNPKVLRLRSRWIENPAKAKLDRALANHQVVRLEGAMGVGKSRCALESCSSSSSVWARCWPEGSAGPSVSAQLVSQMNLAGDWPRPSTPQALDKKIFRGVQRRLEVDEDSQVRTALIDALQPGEADRKIIVVDHAHAADEQDRETIQHLIGGLPEAFRLLVILRPTSRLDWIDAPTVSVEPLDERAARALTSSLTEGLSIPGPVLHHFQTACGGNPFAFEEGLHNLVRRRLLRQNYGNFFFSGPKETQYLPTTRLDRHLLSEALRVQGLEACFRLASANGPTAKELLALSSDLDDRQLQLLINIGLFADHIIDGRPHVDFALPAFRAGFRQCLEDHVIQRLRGELLEPMIGGGSAEQAWATYQNLAGTPKGVEALLEVLGLPKDERPEDGLFEALHRELIAHRDRQGDRATEFELLWEYLPLARKYAEPSSLIPAIERALELCSPGEPRRTALLALHSEEAMVQGELDSAEQRAVEGLDLARKQDPKRQSILLLQLGKVLQRQDRLPEAKKLLLDLLSTVDASANPSQNAACHYHLGNIYLREQDFELALEHHQIALKQRRAHGTATTLGHSLTSLASLNLAIGNYSQSLVLFEEALDTLKDAADPVERAFPLTGIGRTLSRLGDFASATAPFREALELRKRRSDKLGVEISKLTLAHNDFDLGIDERALQEARLALFRLMMIGSRRYRADAEALIGRLLLRQGKAQPALQRLTDAAKLHRQVGAEVDSLFDEASALEACIELGEPDGIERRGDILAERLATAPYPELGERLDLRLHQGWKALGAMGERSGDPAVPLERAYRELCRKTAMLEPERRNRFLLQVPTNRRILRLAQEEGYADPSRLEDLLSSKQESSP